MEIYKRWQFVPVEPTVTMIRASSLACDNNLTENQLRHQYHSMLSVAPVNMTAKELQLEISKLQTLLYYRVCDELTDNINTSAKLLTERTKHIMGE